MSVCNYFAVMPCSTHSYAKEIVHSCLLINLFTCDAFVPLVIVVVKIDVPTCLSKAHHGQSDSFELHDPSFNLRDVYSVSYCTLSSGSNQASTLFNVGKGSSP